MLSKLTRGENTKTLDFPVAYERCRH